MPEGRRTTYMASYNLVFGLVTFLGSLTRGILTERLSALYGMRQANFTEIMVTFILIDHERRFSKNKGAPSQNGGLICMHTPALDSVEAYTRRWPSQ